MASYSLTTDDDTIIGTSGDDVVSGPSGGVDDIETGGGDDTIELQPGPGGAPHGLVAGGAGADLVIVHGSLGDATYTGCETLQLEGDDFSAFVDTQCTIDQLNSFASIDGSRVFDGQDVAFLVSGAGGFLDLSARLQGGLPVLLTAGAMTGAMQVIATACGDSLRGSGFDDTLAGAGGDDLVFGGGGTDSLDGGSGDDLLQIGDDPAGTIDGGAGSDEVGFSLLSDHRGALGSVVFRRVETLDLAGYIVDPSASIAQLSAFSTVTDSSIAHGPALAFGSQLPIDLVGAGGTLDFTTRLGSGLLLVLDASALDGGAVLTGGTLADEILGSGFVDSLTGGAGDDTLSGGGGADSLVGGAGDDRLVGDTGDTLDGGAGADVLALAGGVAIGGPGRDVLELSGEDLTAVSFTGVETLELAASSVIAARIGQLAAVDAITSVFGPVQMELDIAGDGGTLNLAHKLSGGASAYVRADAASGAVRITGGAGDDRLSGSAFDDVLKGGGGADSFEHLSGHDVVDGGPGADTLFAAGSIAGDVLRRVETLDLIGPVQATLAQLDGFSTLATSAVQDGAPAPLQLSLTGRGGALDFGHKAQAGHAVLVDAVGLVTGADFTGTALGDALTCGARNDTLAGGGGNDILAGGAGADQIDGGAGDDVIGGGEGADRLTGGPGSDRFVYAAVEETSGRGDLITDLTARDIIDLQGIDADATTPGDDAFVLVARFDHHAGEAMLRYNARADLTTLSLDVDGDGHADARILLAGDHTDFGGFVL